MPLLCYLLLTGELVKNNGNDGWNFGIYCGDIGHGAGPRILYFSDCAMTAGLRVKGHIVQLLVVPRRLGP